MKGAPRGSGKRQGLLTAGRQSNDEGGRGSQVLHRMARAGRRGGGVQTRHHTKAYPRPANTGGGRRRCCRGALAARATPECSKRERGTQHSSSMPRRALTNHKQGANQGAVGGACGSQQMNGCSAGAMPGAQCQHSTRLAASPNLAGPHALHCQYEPGGAVGCLAGLQQVRCKLAATAIHPRPPGCQKKKKSI